MKIIKSYTGENILVDDEDYDRLNNYRWFFYRRGSQPEKNVVRVCQKDKTKYISMFREIKKCTEKEFAFYKDGSKLNHQKSNLKILSLSEFRRTNGPREGKKYKGVSKLKAVADKYNCTITINKKTVFIGVCDSEIESAQLYDAVMDFFGFKYAYKNFPNEKFCLPENIRDRMEKYKVKS